jgi:hypothetical protein
MRAVFVILAAAALFGCGEAGSGLTDGNDGADEQSSLPPQSDQNQGAALVPQLVLVGDESFPDGRPARISVEVTSLSSDDVAYLSVETAENSQLSITPKNTLLYPTSGVANVVLEISAREVVDSGTVVVNLTTSEGLTVSRTHVISSEK